MSEQQLVEMYMILILSSQKKKKVFFGVIRHHDMISVTFKQNSL